jgi:sporulation protein YlmC with PRC-barrel domain
MIRATSFHLPMQELASKIKGKIIIDRERNMIGRLLFPIIDIHNGQILGFKTTKKRHSILTPGDIFDWQKDLIVLSHQYEFFEPKDIVRLNRTISSKTHIRRKKVFTESGVFLGRVKDYYVDSVKMTMESLLVVNKPLYFITIDKKIINRSQIVEILPKKIIVKDETIKIPVIETQKSRKLENIPA